MSNLIFYSQALDNATVVPDKGSATGHPIENLQDRLLNTYWQSGASSDQVIDIDLGAVMDVDHCLLLHDMTLTTDISLWSASASNYSDEVQRSPSYNSVTAQYMMLGTVDSVIHKYRYWRIKLSNCVTAPKIYLAFIGAKQEITLRYNKGYRDRKVYKGHSLQETPGGMRYSRQYQTRGRKKMDYAWESLDLTNQQSLQTLIDNSQGAALPFFMKKVDDSYLYVRLMNEEVANPEQEFQLYGIETLYFEEEF